MTLQNGRKVFVGRVAALLMTAAAAASSAYGADRFALVVSGASGGDKYAENQKKWLSSLDATLRQRLAFPADHLIILSEGAAQASNATTENVTRSLTTLRQRVTADDVLFVLLMGHGTFDGQSAKFNLVGPDMDAEEWKKLLAGIPGRLIFVDTTSSSFPFVEELSGKGRVIITATDSTAQKYDTIFPELFIAALDATAADTDKNGRLSVFEAFNYASQSVKQWYEKQGMLATERPLFDDNGDGVGQEALGAGTDGALARTAYLDPEPGSGTSNPILAGLQRQRAALEEQIGALRASKGGMPQEQYDAELEKLAVELARVTQQIGTQK